jgi:CRP/FNR family cyclic AMP-dependent transcriptional regulator
MDYRILTEAVRGTSLERAEIMPAEHWLNPVQVLSEHARAALLARAKTIRVRRGQTLLVHGERSSQVFFVLEGKLTVVLYSANGREVTLRELVAGDFFGELAAIDGEDRSANVVAVSDARLMTLTRDNFLAAIHSSPDVADWILRTLAAQVRNLAEKVFEMHVLNIQARLHSELLRLGHSACASGRCEIYPAPTHAELANRIGTNREAITREMKVLSERKIIRTGRRRLEFLDLAELQDSVEKLSLRDFSSLVTVKSTL